MCLRAKPSSAVKIWVVLTGLSLFTCQMNYKHWVCCSVPCCSCMSTWKAHGMTIRCFHHFHLCLCWLYSYQDIHQHIWKILNALLWTMNTMVCCSFKSAFFKSRDFFFCANTIIASLHWPFHSLCSQLSDCHDNVVVSTVGTVLMEKSGKKKKYNSIPPLCNLKL